MQSPLFLGHPRFHTCAEGQGGRSQPESSYFAHSATEDAIRTSAPVYSKNLAYDRCFKPATKYDLPYLDRFESAGFLLKIGTSCELPIMSLYVTVFSPTKTKTSLPAA